MAKVAPKVDAAGTTTVVNDEEFKEMLYEVISGIVREQTGRVLPKPVSRRVFTRLVELVFLRVVEMGYFRFPGGYGSLTLSKMRGTKPRTMPDGQVVTPKPNRHKIRYSSGVTVMEMLGTNPHKYRRKNPRKLPLEGESSATV